MNNKLDEAEDQISNLEDQVRENTNQNRKMKREIFENEDSLRNLWDNIKYSNIYIIGVPEGEQREQGIENLFEEIITENFPGEGKRHTSPGSAESFK